MGMLAAMRTAPVRSSAQDTTPIRDRGDACPGALRLHDADDGALARVRLPGGIVSLRQAGALADAARRFGDGDLHLTSRGNVQLRGLAADCGGELGAALAAAGLLPSRRHERVRNIVASPLAGLDGDGVGVGSEPADGGVRGWLRELDGMLCASESAHALSGRFLFALDDGRGDMARLGADVTLVAGAGMGSGGDEGGGAAWLCVGPEQRSPAFRVPSKHAARAALLTAEAFLQTADASAGRVWRIAELPGGAEELADAVARSLGEAGITATAGARPPGSRTYEPSPGVVTGGAAPGETAALSVLAPMGRVDVAQWRALLSVAEGAGTGTGTGELRLTPWRGVVVPGVPAGEADERLRVLASAGLITGPGDPRAGVGACIGTSGCARSLADVRADAAALTAPPASSGALPVYWSGCERRCGHPRGDRVEVVAVPEGYRVWAVRDGRVQDSTTTAGRASAAAEVARARTGGTGRTEAADSPETVKR